MDLQTYEIVVVVSGIFKTVVQLIIFICMWKMLVEERPSKKTYGLWAVILVVNLLPEFFGDYFGYRYLFTAAISLLYLLVWDRRKWQKGVFLLSLFYSFHSLSFLLADCIYMYLTEALKFPDVSDMSSLYFQVGMGQVGMFLFYAVCVALFVTIFGKMGRNMGEMGVLDMMFLSVINGVAIIFAYMVADLSVVKLENEVFLLFENGKEMLFKIPVIAAFLAIGEFTSIFVWKKYQMLMAERQRALAREEQLKQLKARLEEANTFYGDIRKLRHEMGNHMANIKGLMANGRYGEVDGYVEKLEDVVSGLEYRHYTGNALCDVIINDKCKRAEHLQVQMQVNFLYPKDLSIPIFDVGIILNNLLDNGLEACAKIDSGIPRFLRLEAERKGSFFLITVENPFVGALTWDEEHMLPLTSKMDSRAHGIGLMNVKELADQNLGGIKIETEDHRFKVTVMLQCNREDF